MQGKGRVMSNFLKIHPQDNVVVCLEPMAKGQTLNLSDNESIVIAQDVPAGHKVAIKDIKNGENIIKYGYAIGHYKGNVGSYT